MNVHAESTAAEVLLERPAAPAVVRALYSGLSAARTVTRNTQLGEPGWQRRIRPRLERIEDPGVIEVPCVRQEDLSPAALMEATRSPTPVVFEGLVADSDAVKMWSPKESSRQLRGCSGTRLPPVGGSHPRAGCGDHLVLFGTTSVIRRQP